MKKFIECRYYDSPDQRDIIKEKLNSLGFYALSYGDSGLEIYVLEQREYIEDKLLSLLHLNWLSN